MNFQAANEDDAACQAAVTAVGTFWTAVKPYIGTAVTYESVPQVDVLNPSGGHIGASHTTKFTGAGTAAGSLLPPATQLLCQWRCGSYVNNREIRGRTFIPGVASLTLASGGVPSTATLNALQTACTALIGTTGSKLIVWDRRWSGEIPVTSGGPWNQYAVLRSRRD
jgi:hypothetical protein